MSNCIRNVENFLPSNTSERYEKYLVIHVKLIVSNPRHLIPSTIKLIPSLGLSSCEYLQ